MKNGGFIMQERRGLGNKKINRVNLSLSNEYLLKLRWMAQACGFRPTELAGMLLEMILDDPQKMYDLQDEFCRYEAYRVRVVRMMGHTHYELPGGRYD
jgi:hypothetical protein